MILGDDTDSYYLSGSYFASDTVLRAYINSFFSSAHKDSEVGTIIPIEQFMELTKTLSNLCPWSLGNK